MTRAALIAGISVVTLLCAGRPSEVSAAWNSDSWWGNTYRMFEPFEPPPRRTFKPRAKPAEGKSKQNESKNDNTPPITPGLLHVIVSPVLLVLFYFGAVLPIGLVLRLSGKDLLRLRRTDKSYWIERQPPGPEPKTMTEVY